MDASSEPKQESNTAPSQLLALPPAGSAGPTLEVGGDAVRLDTLGPMIVNKDGTLSRVQNWDKMEEFEREATLRIIGKRNKVRLAALRAEKAASGKSEDTTETDEAK
ncbi:hypothetical protein GGR50DRAFT_694639 [Xylaria sp. CBS 124048]|nr:hypothetical protein GGR50DRAFT_694639 [Xylaria sp. CBS 124048]